MGHKTEKYSFGQHLIQRFREVIRSPAPFLWHPPTSRSYSDHRWAPVTTTLAVTILGFISSARKAEDDKASPSQTCRGERFPASPEIHFDWASLDHVPTSTQSLQPEAGMPWWLSPGQGCILRLEGDGKGRGKTLITFQSHIFPTHSSQVTFRQHPSIFSSLSAVSWIVSYKKLCWSPSPQYLEMWPYLESLCRWSN